MSIIKRNAVIITVLVFVCAAVYLNWAYNKDEEAAALTGSETGDAGLYYTSELSDTVETSGDIGESAESAVQVSDYFAAARLTREQARDSALEILRQASDAEDASQEIVDEALGEISVMAQYTVSEAQIENLVIAKGYSECVAFITGDGISVTVAAPEGGLTDADVARISEIIMDETGFDADSIKIIEVR